MVTKEQIEAARQLGREAGEDAGSRAADGDMPTDYIWAVLRLAEEGTGPVLDYLPSYPDLSGEMADSETPQSLAAAILGADWETHGNNAPDFVPSEDVDDIATAWEEGVSETFEEACIRTLRWFLSDDDDRKLDIAPE